MLACNCKEFLYVSRDSKGQEPIFEDRETILPARIRRHTKAQVLWKMEDSGSRPLEWQAFTAGVRIVIVVVVMHMPAPSVDFNFTVF
jgi:hypothetical protein